MALPQSAIDHYRQQQAIAIETTLEVNNLWRRGMGDDFELSWTGLAPEVFATVIAGQLAAADSGLAYVPAVLAEQSIAAPEVAAVNPQRFMGAAPDGRPLETLLHGAVYEAKTRVGNGATTTQALTIAGSWLQDVVMDSVREANRQAVASSYTTRPAVQGWVRMLNPPSCKFCIVLAGKFFRWNQGFQSHPECDCRHIPTKEALAGDLTIDPYAYFHGLTEKEQNRLFGKNDAQAIRDGGDIYRIVNTRGRGLADNVLKNTPGHNRGWQSRRWDSPSLMTIDDVYAAARNREHAIELMRENGFITGDQIAGGNLIGNRPSAFGDLAAGQLGRGGTRKGATLAYRGAIRTGVRDPLEPATQTAAERRLHQAVLMKQAVDQGRNPFAINSARTPLTADVTEMVNRQYIRELNRLPDGPEQVRVLARLLGVL